MINILNKNIKKLIIFFIITCCVIQLKINIIICETEVIDNIEKIKILKEEIKTIKV